MPTGGEQLLLFAVAIGCFLLGGINTALIISTLGGLPDPRSGGSNNPGATNMARVAGPVAGVLTLIGDIAKGMIAICIVQALLDGGYLVAVDWALAVAMCAVVAGHVWPVYHKFQGGKGVATWAGALALATPVLAVCAGATWLVTLALFRKVGLASVVAAASVPLYAWLGSTSMPLTWAASALGVLVVIRHRQNLESIWKHGEDV